MYVVQPPLDSEHPNFKDIRMSDQAEAIIDNQLVRWRNWNELTGRFGHMEIIEEVEHSLACSPLFFFVFQIGAVTFYRRQ